MTAIDVPTQQPSRAVTRDQPVRLGGEGHGRNTATVGGELEQCLAGCAVVEPKSSATVSGPETFVSSRGREGRDGRGIRREVVDTGKLWLAFATAQELPGGDAACIVADDDRAIAEQETEHGDFRTKPLRYACRRPRPGLSTAELDRDYFTLRRAREEIVAATVDCQRRHLAGRGQDECVARFLPRLLADERGLFGDALDDDLLALDRRGGHRPTFAGRVRENADRPASRIDTHRLERPHVALHAPSF